MVVGFASIALAARREWHEERFSALYLDETLAGAQEVSVLFADLARLHAVLRAHEPGEVHAMLVAYFGRLAPLIGDGGGEVHEFVGDQIFAVFNKAGRQPDHAVRAARAALELQRAAAGRRAGIRTGRSSASASTAARCWRRRRRPRAPHPRRLRRHRQPRRAPRERSRPSAAC